MRRVKQLRAGGAMIAPSDPAAAKQRRIGGIDDGIQRERGEVGLNGTQGGRHLG